MFNLEQAIKSWKQHKWIPNMLPNYLKVGFRNLKKDKGYSVINIAGLTIGLAAFLALGLYIRFELSFDSYHAKANRIYNVMIQYPEGTFFGGPPLAVTPAPMAGTLREEVPEVETATTVNVINTLFIKEDLNNFEDGIAADPTFFDVFSYEWLAGDPNTALLDPGSLVLTKSLAKKYFPHENPLGKTIEAKLWGQGEKKLKTVTGVIDDVLVNSHFTFDYILPVESDPFFVSNLTSASSWTNFNYYTYFSLQSQTQIENVKNKITELLQSKLESTPYYSDKSQDKLPSYKFMPLKDIRLYSSEVRYPITTQNSIRTIYLFGVIALIILLIACVNYMNLATARSIRRAKEIGIRKVAGANRINLIFQLISESIIVAFVSILMAITVVQLALPYFSQFIGYELPADLLNNTEVLIILLGIGLMVGIISGSYPAFYMSALSPVNVFKNSFRGSKSNLWLRNLLIVGQFTVTIVLMISAVVIYRQINFIQNKDTGFEREQVPVMRIRDNSLRERYETFKQEVMQHPDIHAISSSDNVPIHISQRTSSVRWDGKSENSDFSIYGTRVNFQYLDLFNFEILAGRSFSRAQDGEGNRNYILNERAIKEIGWDMEEALGKSFTLWGYTGKVVGVVKDFHFRSFHDEIRPIVFMLDPPGSKNYVFAKIDSEKTSEVLSHLGNVFAEFSPEYPFDYFFLNDEYNRMYEAELRFGVVFNAFTILALVIACLGLFSLSAFMTEQRTKEIGIRKVFGASVSRIIAVLNQDFIKLVLVSFVVAVPISLILMNRWLQEFAYRIEIGIGIFLLAGAAVLLIAFLTVSFQSVKAAFMNPVESLRSE